METKSILNYVVEVEQTMNDISLNTYLSRIQT